MAKKGTTKKFKEAKQGVIQTIKDERKEAGLDTSERLVNILEEDIDMSAPKRKATKKEAKIEESKRAEMGCGTSARLQMLFNADEPFESTIQEEAILLGEPVVELAPAPIATRAILLKLKLTQATSCCGSGGDSSKYARLVIKQVDGKWILVEHSRLYGNYIRLIKDVGKWAGTVHNMGLHEDADFMAQLAEEGLLDKGGVVIPC